MKLELGSGVGQVRLVARPMAGLCKESRVGCNLEYYVRYFGKYLSGVGMLFPRHR